jgi:hypothetical protein
MKEIFVACAGLAGVTLAGCNGVTNAVNGIDAITGALSSPAANQAAANLKTGTTAVVCDVGNVAALASKIEAAIRAGSALVKDTADVYTVSSSVCAALGGASQGTATVPPSASTVIPAAPASGS